MQLISQIIFLVLIWSSLGQGKTIVKVEFVPNTFSVKEGTDGIVKVSIKEKATDPAQMGTICRLGITITEATVLCYEMGFEKGVIIQTNKKADGEAIILKDMRCTVNMNDPKTLKADHCAFTSPSTACDKAGPLAILCVNKRPVIVTTKKPDTSPLPPINCSSGSELIRLMDGTNVSGRVEIFNKGKWGAICNIGFNDNEAKVICKMLCKNSDYAQAVTGNYSVGSTTYQLANLKCPPNAKATSDCTHGGWGKAPSRCNKHTNAWVNCAPPETPSPPKVPNPTVNCSDGVAMVYFNKTENPDLKNDMVIHVPDNSKDYEKKDCDFQVNDTVSDDYVIASFYFTKCGGTPKAEPGNNTTSYTNKLLRVYKPVDGIVDNVNYTIYVVCRVPIKNKGEGGSIERASVTVRPDAGTDALKLSLKLYNSSEMMEFQLLKPGSKIVLGSKIYVLVQEKADLANNQMAVRNCWATQTEKSNSSPRKDLIIEACPKPYVSAIRSIDAMTQSFSFNAFLFAGKPETIYVHCETNTCHKDNEELKCSRACILKRRRKRNINEALAHFLKQNSLGERTVNEGPFYILSGVNSSVCSAGSSILLVLAALLLWTI